MLLNRMAEVDVVLLVRSFFLCGVMAVGEHFASIRDMDFQAKDR